MVCRLGYNKITTILLLATRGLDVKPASNPNQLCSGWYFHNYFPGDWEALMDGEKLEELGKKHAQFLKDKVEKEKQRQAQEAREREETRPLNAEEKELGKKFGLDV